MGSATVIANEQAVANVQERLEQHRDELAALRGEADQTDAELDDLLVAQGLGEKVDAKRLEMLERKQTQLGRKAKQSERIIAGLQGQIRVWDAEGAQRRYEAALAEMREIAKQAPELEAAYCDVTSQQVALAAEIRATRRRWRELEFDVSRYSHTNGLPGHGLRGPYMPFAVPAAYLSDHGSPASWEQFLREWKETHR